MRMILSALLIVGLAGMGLGALGAPTTPPPDLDNALAAQQELAAQRADDPQVLNDLGNLLVLVGRGQEAEDAYRSALELAPDMVSARYNLGLLLSQRGDRRLALEQFKAVLAEQPDHAWAHYQTGVIFEARQSKKKALEHYSQAFRLDPQLAFPEVNAHVIDNAYVTEALLLAYQNLASTAAAPKTYEEGSRIVSLMVADAPGQSPTEAAETMGAEAEVMEGGAAEMAAPAEGGTGSESAGPPGSEEGGGRVLRQQDLEEGRGLNQAQPQGSTYYPPRGGVRTTPRAPTYRPPTANRPQTTPNPSRGNTREIQPSNGRLRFVPGVQSTGRLEIELLGPGTGSDDEIG